MANQKKAEYPKEPMKTQETTSKQPKARGDHVVIGFSFASDWLRDVKQNQSNPKFTFNTQLEIALVITVRGSLCPY